MEHDGCSVPWEPCGRKTDTGHVGTGLGKGSGVLLPGVTTFFLVKGVFGHNDRNCAIVAFILGDCDIFFTPGSTRLAIPASQPYGVVSPQCNCDARITCDL
jgi:hypothetical protein